MFNGKKIKLLCLSLIVFVASSQLFSAQAEAAGEGEFPIGIFWPPSPQQTNAQAYEDIADMNVNFIIGGNGVNSFTLNDTALALANDNNLGILVDDSHLVWREYAVTQETTGSGLNVSNTNTIGQTFTTPAGTGWGLNTVELYIDKLNWPSGVTLTLSLYDSKAKNTLYASDSIIGPVNTYHPKFSLHTAVSSNKTYYMELSSNSSTPVGWVITSAGNSYNGGNAYNHNTALTSDMWFKLNYSQRAYNDGHQPATPTLTSIANYYKNKPGVMGYHIYDEPSSDLMARIDQTIQHIKTIDSTGMSFVNLFPNYATDSQLGLDRFSGEFISSSTPLGQTFKTKSNQTRVNTVQWWIDRSQWASGEQITLTLWNSPAKTTAIASHTISSAPNNNWPIFNLNANVLPSTSYYMELTHNGGGNNHIGWVVRSNTNEQWDNDGSAHISGSAIQADFWYTINQSIQGRTYEDYVYRWVKKQPDVLSFDHYPFLLNGTMRSDYYSNLEVISRQARLANIDFWSYIQSVGVTGVWRAPSENDMRYQIYTNLAYGAKGYIYFTYQTPQSSGGESFFNGIILPNGTKNTSYTWAQQLNGEVLNIGSTLMELKHQAVYHTGSLPADTTAVPSNLFVQPVTTTNPSIISWFEDASNRKYVLIVNRDNVNGRMLSFNFNPKPTSLVEISKATGNEISTTYNSSTGNISSYFAAGEGKLYALPVGY